MSFSGIIAAASFGRFGGVTPEPEPERLPVVATFLETPMTFNGTSDYVNFPDSDALSFVDLEGDVPFEIELYATFTELNGTLKWVFSKRQGNATAAEYQLFISAANELTFVQFQGGSNTVSIGRIVPASEITTGVEYKITIKGDGSQTREGIQIFLNDVRKDSVDYGASTYTGMVNTTSVFTIGRAEFAAAFYFKGTIRNLIIKK